MAFVCGGDFYRARFCPKQKGCLSTPFILHLLARFASLLRLATSSVLEESFGRVRWVANEIQPQCLPLLTLLGWGAVHEKTQGFRKEFG